MPHEIYCLIINGASLSDAVADVLFHTARKMWTNKKRKQRVQNGKVEGLVETKNKLVLLGCISGIEFSARIDCDHRSLNTRFIVRVGHLEQEVLDGLAWGNLAIEAFANAMDPINN